MVATLGDRDSRHGNDATGVPATRNNAFIPAVANATMRYDGLHRRAVKQIANCGDWDSRLAYTWDVNWRKRGQDPFPSSEPVADPGDHPEKGPDPFSAFSAYVDDLVQLAINDDPTDAAEDDCESFYYPMQNVNFNVMGLTDVAGTLVERYEYTPYGQRTVYSKAGGNDALTTAPLLCSQPVLTDSGPAPCGLCDFGHQGLSHDKEFGWWDNRLRYGDPMGRWPQRDPAGYPDGLNLYEIARSRPVGPLDPFGLRVSVQFATAEGTKAQEESRDIDEQGLTRFRQHIWQWLYAICPCVDLLQTTRPDRGASNVTFVLEMWNLPGQTVQKCCNCVRASPTGCKLLRDLLQSDETYSITYGRKLSKGSPAEYITNGNIRIDDQKTQSFRRDHTRDLLDRQTHPHIILGHELAHAHADLPMPLPGQTALARPVPRPVLTGSYVLGPADQEKVAA